MPGADLVAALRWGAFGPLLLTCLVIMGSPGPATISLVTAGSARGVRRSLPYLGGIVAGTIAVLLAVATGVTVLLLAIPAIRVALTLASAAYILWLAYHIAKAPALTGPASTSGAYSFAGGAVLGFANPKGWIAIAAVFGSTHLGGPAATDAVAKVVVLAAMVALICTTWLVLGTSIAPLLRDRRRARVANLTLAAAVVAATGLALAR